MSSATLQLLKDGEVGEAYHISTNRLISIADLVQLICTKMRKDFENNVKITGERLGKDSAYKLDSSKIRDKLGWKDKTSLEVGLDQTIKWVQSNLEKLKAQPKSYIHKK